MTTYAPAAEPTSPAAAPPLVVGLDLSITATGLAHASGLTITITGQAKGDRRLLHISDAATMAVAPLGEALVDLAVIEDLPTHAHGAGITGMVHGVVRDALIRVGVPYVLIPPATLKKFATGRGNANKADMRMALFQRTGLDVRDDNQADAAWLRFLGLELLGHPAVSLPRQNLDALAKIALPEGVAAHG